MRRDFWVKLLAVVLIAAGLVVGALIWIIWDTFLGEIAREYPIFAVLGAFVFAALCLPQIIGGLLSWYFGSVMRGMELNERPRDREHWVLRVFMGLAGLILAGVLGLSGISFAFDFGLSSVCGVILLILAALGPKRVAGLA